MKLFCQETKKLAVLLIMDKPLKGVNTFEIWLKLSVTCNYLAQHLNKNVRGIVKRLCDFTLLAHNGTSPI